MYKKNKMSTMPLRWIACHQIMVVAVLLNAAFLVGPQTASATTISFTPSGTSTVGQGTNLFWDIISDATSTVSSFGPWNFELTDHGDFHFDSSSADIINAGLGTGGVNLAPGTLIGPGSNFPNPADFVGTTDVGGGCAIGNTCIYGLSFELAGQDHFGWVQFEEAASTQSLLGWAYNDIAGATILAGATGTPIPEPSTFLLLGTGLLGLLGYGWRKRKQAEVAAHTT